MRNLKKALAMVLALMMAVSLMSFASASDYADGGKIEKTEAVEVMSMINVFQGTDGGNFDPEGNLTRAQAAKIISYMKLGSAVADALPKDEAPFNDVKADRWYTGYVTYAKSEGIIAGRSETTFDPNGNVTGYEFGKMVLEAAGIKGEYTGTSSWMLNINLALRGNNPGKIDLMTGVNAVLSSPISRENACQLAFNALNYTATGETTGNFVITGTASGDPGTSDLDGMVCSSRSEAAMLIALLDNGGSYTIEAERNNRGSLADVVFSLEKSRGTSTFGAPANVWTSGDKSVTVADAATKSYEKTTGKAVKADLKMTGTINAVIVTDGLAADSAELTDATALGGNGSKVDVYKVDDSNVKIVVVNTYVATIDSHTDAKGDNKEKITLTLDTNKPATNTTADFETTNFTADDKGAVVLYTAKKTDATHATIQSVTVPAEVKGTVTRFSNGTFVVGGTTYKLSEKVHSTKTVTSGNVGKEMTMYLDNNGNVIYAAGEAAPETVYAVVLTWDKIGGGRNPRYTVKLLLSDNTTVDADMGTLTDTDGSSNIDVDDTSMGNVEFTIVKYVADGDKANLTKIANAAASSWTGYATIAKGTNSSDIGKITRNVPALTANIVANSQTVFFIGSSDGKTLSSYTGISAVPSVTALAKANGDPDTGATDFQIVAENGVAKLVYVKVSTPVNAPNEVTDTIYVVGTGETTTEYEGGEAVTYKTYPAVVNGEITTIKTTEGVTGMPANSSSAVLLKSVNKNDKGLITSGTPMDGENYIAPAYTNSVPANGVIKIGSTNYVYNDSTKVYVYADGEITAKAITAVTEDMGAVTGYKKDGVIAELFILAGAEAPHEHSLGAWATAANTDTEAVSGVTYNVGDHIQTCTECHKVVHAHEPSAAANSYTLDGGKHKANCTGAAGCTVKVEHNPQMECDDPGDASTSWNNHSVTNGTTTCAVDGCNVTGTCTKTHSASDPK